MTRMTLAGRGLSRDERAPVAEYELPRRSNLERVPRWDTLDDAIRHWAAAKPDAAAGRVIPETQVRLFAEDGSELPSGAGPGRPGRPGSVGIVRSGGYYDDPAANAELFTPDGWMLMGDLVTIDEEHYLTVVGRTSDFIIRGGKNISAPAVEDEVSSMTGLVRCAAVAMPDEMFGERVCVYVIPAPGVEVTLDDVREHLSVRGVSKEWFPEYLVVVDELPVALPDRADRHGLCGHARADRGHVERGRPGHSGQRPAHRCGDRRRDRPHQGTHPQPVRREHAR